MGGFAGQALGGFEAEEIIGAIEPGFVVDGDGGNWSGG